MILDLIHYLAGLLLVAGAVLGLAAAAGLLRLPDLLTRMHAVFKPGTLGAVLVLAGAALVTLDAAAMLRAAVGGAFLVLAAPILAHLLAPAAPDAGDSEEK